MKLQISLHEIQQLTIQLTEGQLESVIGLQAG